MNLLNPDEALRNAIRADVSIKEFNEMTPYELFLTIDIYSKKEKEKQSSKLREIYIAAVWTSRWVFAKKIPSFESILKESEPRKDMTDEEMLLKVQQLNAVFGGEVKKVGKE